MFFNRLVAGACLEAAALQRLPFWQRRVRTLTPYALLAQRAAVKVIGQEGRQKESEKEEDGQGRSGRSSSWEANPTGRETTTVRRMERRDDEEEEEKE